MFNIFRRKKEFNDIPKVFNIPMPKIKPLKEEIKKGNLIHHIDFNKNNNCLDNLKEMDYFEHNKIHTRTAWNKGIKTNKSTIKKQTKQKEKSI